MDLSAKQKAEMESFVSCLNNLLSKFRYKLEADKRVLITVQPKTEPPVKDLQVDQPKSARPLQVGDRVITLQNGNNAVRFDFAGQGNKEVCNGSYRSVLTRGLSPAPASSSFSPVKTRLGVWASLPPALQKDAAEDTLRMLVRLYGEENK